MTKFVKENFLNDGDYVNYLVDGDWGKRKFVARFKYAKGGKGTFITFLIKNFTVEEYFARYEAGEAPLTILQSKGYIQPHIKKWLKEGGYEVSRAGYEKMLADQVAASMAKRAA